MWSWRATLEGVISFAGKTRKDCGDEWWTWYRWVPAKYQSPLTITFGEVATHNHFVLDRGGKVFKQTAPVIKLPAGSSEDDHLGLLGLLNSSVACFWLKQVCFNKGNGGIGGGISDEKWELRYAHNASQVADFPLAADRPLGLASRMDGLVQALSIESTAALLAQSPLPDQAALNAARERGTSLRRSMIALQEELDWQCYGFYGLLPDASTTADFHFADPPEVNLGERAFEFVLARRVAAGDESTVWFERHGSIPTTELPAHWPADYRAVVERRIALIESDRNIGLIERPEFKRRWNTPAWEDLEQAALRGWLLDRL